MPRGVEGNDFAPSAASPSSVEELLAAARALAGVRLGDLAERMSVVVPMEIRRGKGFAGQLLESVLGASAGSRAEPDFPELGVELKTLPVDRSGRPLETTFVCTVELPELDRSEWETSRLRKKLARVLWVPVLAERAIPLRDRVLGAAVLWTPDAAEEEQLRRDWEMLVERMLLGRSGSLTARVGVALQVRPKAAKGASRRRAFDEEGALSDEQPKGFYLRKEFTRAILERNLAIGKG